MSLVLEKEAAFLELAPLPKKQQPAFLVRAQLAERHVVVPDLHGEYRVLEDIIDAYIDEADIDFVFLGDILDRKGAPNDPEKGVFRTLDMVKQLGNRAVVTIANHEWLFHASGSAADPHRQVIAKEWLSSGPKHSIEQNVLAAYDMDPWRRDYTTVDELRRRMARVGHLSLLSNATPYFETINFIATHAGVMPGVPWEVQRNYLNEVSQEMDDGLFYDRPPQWFSMKLATSTEPIQHTKKTVVSGHAHVLRHQSKRYPLQSSERSLHDGRRIRLASTLNHPTSASAYVWQDWDGRIVEIPR